MHELCSIFCVVMFYVSLFARNIVQGVWHEVCSLIKGVIHCKNLLPTWECAIIITIYIDIAWY